MYRIIFSAFLSSVVFFERLKSFSPASWNLLKINLVVPLHHQARSFSGKFARGKESHKQVCSIFILSSFSSIGVLLTFLSIISGSMHGINIWFLQLASTRSSKETRKRCSLYNWSLLYNWYHSNSIPPFISRKSRRNRAIQLVSNQSVPLKTEKFETFD